MLNCNLKKPHAIGIVKTFKTHCKIALPSLSSYDLQPCNVSKFGDGKYMRSLTAPQLACCIHRLANNMGRLSSTRKTDCKYQACLDLSFLRLDPLAAFAYISLAGLMQVGVNSVVLSGLHNCVTLQSAPRPSNTLQDACTLQAPS